MIFPIFSLHILLFFLSLNTNDGFSRFPFSSFLPSSLQTGSGETALIWAADNGYDTVIALLLEADAQIDAQSNSGNTPLICASVNGKEAAVRELLKGNPNLDLKSKSGKTALDWARERKHQSVVDLLVKYKGP